MSFKYAISSSVSRAICLSVSCVLLLTSCGTPWGEKAAEPVSPETKLGQEAKCLSDLAPVVSGFVEGTAQPEQVGALWDCVDEALGLFEQKVRGADPRFYSSREVARFFEDFFLSADVKINDRLLNEVMRFKQLLAGGANNRMTREELSKLRAATRQLRELTVELLPQMTILVQKWAVSGVDLEQDFVRFDEAKTVSQSSIVKLAAMFEPQGQSYELANFVVLLEELQVVLKQEWAFSGQLKKLMPLLGRLKASLTGTEETVIRPKEWRKFGLLGLRSYFQYLRYHYFIDANPTSGQDSELILIFKSIDDLMQTVGEILTEKSGSSLSRDEIVSIARALADVFPDIVIPESLIDETFKVKRLFFGGDLTKITVKDLEQGRLKLETFRSVAKVFIQYAPILEGKWDPKSLPVDQAQSQFAKAESGIQELVRIGTPLFQGDYDLKDLPRFIAAFELAFPPKASIKNTLSENLNAVFPLIVKGKELILADSGSVILAADWPMLLQVLGPAYARALEFNYFLKDESFFYSPGLLLFETWVEKVADILNAMILARGRGTAKTIEVGELSSTLQTLESLNYWPDGIPLKSVQGVLPIIVKRFLTPPENRTRRLIETGISLTGIQTLRTEISLWFQVQKKLDRIAGQSPNAKISHADLRKQFAPRTEIGDSEIHRLIDTSISLAFDSKGRLPLARAAQVSYDQDSLRNLNLIRAGVRYAIRSYGDEAQSKDLSGLMPEQFDRMFLDFRQIMADLGFVEPDNTSFAESRFLEANIFTPFADGDKYLDYSEGGSIAVMILSGLNLHKLVENSIKAKCPPRSDFYNVDCALEVIRQKAPTAFSSMPGMARLLDLGDKAQTTSMLNELLKAAGWVPNAQRVAKMTDISLVPHVLQYVDALFRRWDSDGNGILDREEAIRAEPMFHALIKEVSNLEDDQWVRAVFAYILVKGKAPETFWEKFEFASGWVGKDSSWPIMADRYRVAQILGFISDSIRGVKSMNVHQ